MYQMAWNRGKAEQRSNSLHQYRNIYIYKSIHTETPMRSIQISRVSSWKDDSVYTLNVSGRFTPDFSRWQHLSCKLHRQWWFNSWLIKISWRSLGTGRRKRSQRMAKTKNYFRQVRKICLAFKTLLVFRMPPVPLNHLTLFCQSPGVSSLPVLALYFNPKSLQTGVGIRLLTAGVLLGCPRRLVNGL